MHELKYCPACGSSLAVKERSGRERLICSDSQCDFTFWHNPVPVVGAILEYEGQVILTRNTWWPEDWFGIVTGFLESNESPEEGVLREIKEETGLEGEIVSFMGNFSFPRKNELIIIFHVKGFGTLKKGEELAEIKVVSPSKLRPWDSPTGEAVRIWLAQRGIVNDLITRHR